MSARVRFAPSPTGHLHIGGARTALYNFFYARAVGGTFVLRIEDTDQERSKKEYEQLQIKDLEWLGLEYDEGPERPGKFGPYRQSERLAIYQKYAQELLNEKKAFYCFCGHTELEAKKQQALSEKKDTHYDGTCKKIDLKTARERVENGEKASIRLIAPLKSFELNDLVRGKTIFPANMVGDFVIMRSNGVPVYNFCCVVDDWKMEITHVIRGEDHLSNTVRQLMVYEALKAPLPEFAHVSLLVGKDRQKLSKRHGATAVCHYREQAYLPQAVVNYLCLLGWSHPEEKNIFDDKELKKIFTLERFNKSPATFDLEKFRWVNGQHLRQQTDAEILNQCIPFINKNSPFHRKNDEWKLKVIGLFKEKIEFYRELDDQLQYLFDENIEKSEGLEEALSWESTPQIKLYLQNKLQELKTNGTQYIDLETFDGLSNHLKNEMKIKGKFLFKGMRAVLTGRDHGPDLKEMIPLTEIDIILKRIEKIG